MFFFQYKTSPETTAATACDDDEYVYYLYVDGTPIVEHSRDGPRRTGDLLRPGPAAVERASVASVSTSAAACSKPRPPPSYEEATGTPPPPGYNNNWQDDVRDGHVVRPEIEDEDPDVGATRRDLSVERGPPGISPPPQQTTSEKKLKQD